MQRFAFSPIPFRGLRARGQVWLSNGWRLEGWRRGFVVDASSELVASREGVVGGCFHEA